MFKASTLTSSPSCVLTILLTPGLPISPPATTAPLGAGESRPCTGANAGPDRQPAAAACSADSERDDAELWNYVTAPRSSVACAHIWPPELDADAACQDCDLTYSDWSM